MVRDITERKQAETALRSSEQRFHLLVEGARDYAIFMLDPQGRVATWNVGAERIKGYRADEIVGQHFSKFYPQEMIERGKPEHELEVAAAEGRFEDEGWRIRKDGSRFWANVIITALREPDDQLLGFAKITRDFTDRKSAEESLVLELSKAVLTNPDILQMLAAIEASIQRLIPHDYATLALHDLSSTHELHVQELPSLRQPASPKEGVLPIEGTPDGWVFIHQEPLLMTQLDAKKAGAPTLQLAAGIKSGCWVPLNSRGEVIGTLFVGTRNEVALNSGCRHAPSGGQPDCGNRQDRPRLSPHCSAQQQTQRGKAISRGRASHGVQLRGNRGRKPRPEDRVEAGGNRGFHRRNRTDSGGDRDR